ncbi:MAG: hypothetical protein OXI01_03985 [Albidovulum sp.]|nr:hypothetical protein [Albidovulum sp.]
MPDYLAANGGLGEATIRRCLPCLERFIADRSGDELGDLNSIALSDILAFQYRRTEGAQSRRHLQLRLHLRNLSKFLYRSGKIQRSLSDSIPAAARPKATNLRRHLDAGDVRPQKKAVRTDDAIGRRGNAL